MELEKEVTKTREFSFYISNPPWNDSMLLHELYASFVNPYLLVGEKESEDPTECRWGNIEPILKEYNINYRVDGSEFQKIKFKAVDRKSAENLINTVFDKIKEVCGPKYPVELELGGLGLAIYNLNFLEISPDSRH